MNDRERSVQGSEVANAQRANYSVGKLRLGDAERRAPREVAKMEAALGVRALNSTVDKSGGDWQLKASCLEVHPEIFFPTKGESNREAKRVCAQCPVRLKCLQYALDIDEEYGIWGGLTESERRKLIKAS